MEKYTAVIASLILINFAVSVFVVVAINNILKAEFNNTPELKKEYGILKIYSALSTNKYLDSTKNKSNYLFFRKRTLNLFLFLKISLIVTAILVITYILVGFIFATK